MRLQETIIIGHAAAICRKEKQDFVLNVVKTLCESGYNAVVIYVGEYLDQEYLDELKKQIASCKLREHVFFAGQAKNIQNLLTIIDLLMLPNSSDFSEFVKTSSLEAIEAESLSLRVIWSRQAIFARPVESAIALRREI